MDWRRLAVLASVTASGCAVDNPRFVARATDGLLGSTGASDGDDGDDDAGDSAPNDLGAGAAVPSPRPTQFAVVFAADGFCAGEFYGDCQLAFAPETGWSLDACCEWEDDMCTDGGIPSVPIRFEPIAPATLFAGRVVHVRAGAQMTPDGCRVNWFEMDDDGLLPIFAGARVPDHGLATLSVTPFDEEADDCPCADPGPMCCSTEPGSYSLRFSHPDFPALPGALIPETGELSGQFAETAIVEVRNFLSHRRPGCQDVMEVDWAFALQGDPDP